MARRTKTLINAAMVTDHDLCAAFTYVSVTPQRLGRESGRYALLQQFVSRLLNRRHFGNQGKPVDYNVTGKYEA